MYIPLYKAQELQVMGNGVVTEGRTILVITQVSSGLKKLCMFIFRKYKCLQVEIASLASVDYLSGLAL